MRKTSRRIFLLGIALLTLAIMSHWPLILRNRFLRRSADFVFDAVLLLAEFAERGAADELSDYVVAARGNSSETRFHGRRFPTIASPWLRSPLCS